ncbi:hypothetical protein TCAL_00057 [Tigriopus californicus]|uniref:EF-hand domain-containing protein n=1 Tax=Tigriopus californicus TaxID=6832 RepID=A0A553PFI6_TIGCA|nr:hypothetical protein TCAL_00057 [Tigriopus californicus]|eukprot:TCALIF_00057-PA protein Name:"Similar to GUCA1B Guanylyl cyclase-activating protein 2 (Bos taurus)" AED:0.15 eAED:0.22 QI:0/-1/0/1/-1/1/1/0/250
MGQVETKIFEDAPPWDVKTVMDRTDLDEESIDICWRMWCEHPLVNRNKIKEPDFYKLLDIGPNDPEEHRTAKKMFELLDRDDDQDLEFVDTMIFLFSMDQELTQEQKLRRSFHFYDRTETGSITKQEMVEALDLLELLDMEHDKKGKVIIPDHVENLFSLMDFAHNNRINENEFMRAAKHYRKLGLTLTVHLLERNRKKLIEAVKEFSANEVKLDAMKGARKKSGLAGQLGVSIQEFKDKQLPPKEGKQE